MERLRNNILKYTLSLVLLLALVVTLPISTQEISAQETSAQTVEIDSNVKYNADNSEASIIFDEKSLNEEYTLTSVIDQSEMKIEVGEGHEYVVSENGTYSFTFNYLDKNQVEKNFVKEVIVDRIGTVGVNSANPWRSPLLRSQVVGNSEVTDGGVTISIPDYDGVGWDVFEGGNYFNIKELTFIINYQDLTSRGKKATISIPDGLTITSMSVVGSTDLYPGINKSITSVYEPNHPLTAAIKSMTAPTTDTLGSSFGDFTYEFLDTTESVTITMSVMVDPKKYYGTHKLQNAIIVSAEKEGTSIGTAIQPINATGIGISPRHTYDTTVLGSKEVLQSNDASNLNEGRVTQTLFVRTNYNGSGYLYFKGLEYKLKYPEGLSYSGVNLTPNFKLDSVDESTNTVVIKDTTDVNSFVPSSIGHFTSAEVLYNVPVGTPLGTYTNPELETVDVTFYDGSTKTYTLTAAPYSVEVVDKIDNKLEHKQPWSFSTGFDNTVTDKHFSYVGEFEVRNSSEITVTDQVFEMIVEPSFKTTSVFIPFDLDEPTNVVYKTNKNPNERSFAGKLPAHVAHATGGDPSPGGTREVSKTLLGLDADEYLTYVRADIGSFRSGYMTAGNYGTNDRIVIYGALRTGATNAKLTYNIFDKNSPVENRLTRELDIKGSTNNRVATDVVNAYTPLTVNAGQTFKVEGRMKLYSPYVTYSSRNTTNIIQNPKLYYIEEIGHLANIEDMTLKDQSGKDVAFTYTSRISADGKKIYTIDPEFDYIANYIGEDRATREDRWLSFSFGVATNARSKTGSSSNNLLWTGDDATGGTDLTMGVTDVYDVNQDGITNQLLSRVTTHSVNVVPNANVIVETGLSVEGQPSLPQYDPTNDETVAYFTPGINADYKINILNNGEAPAESMDLYIPIPNTGLDFGEFFQDEPFQWDMAVSAEIPARTGYSISYSTDAEPGNYVDDASSTATYSTTFPANPSEIKMVKISTTGTIPVGGGEEFHLPLIVDETFETATTGNKIGTRNVFNPAYLVKSDTFTGILKGTRVGTELVIAEIGGTIFQDVNADGLYKAADGDTLLPGETVELYKWNETTSTYEAVMNGGTQVTATSDANGLYLFDSSLGLDYSNYAIKFVEKSGGVYQYTKNNSIAANKTIDSDAIITNDIPNVGDTYRGWVLDIEATKADAKTIGVGFLEYNPPIDLTVVIDEEPNVVKVGDTITVGSTVTPEFFDEIKDKSAAYTWTIEGGATEEAKATLINNNDGTVTIVPNDLASGETTFEMTVTIKDIYGNTATSETATITIYSNVAPTVTADDVVSYVGDPVSNIIDNSNLAALDNTSTDITLVYAAGATKNTTVTHAVPNDGTNFTESGTYEVTYTVTDKWGNVGSVTKLVKIHEAPVVSAYASKYVLGIDEVTILADITDNVTASWVMAPDVVGAASTVEISGPANTTGGNDTIMYELDASNPSVDFSVPGLYKVNYTATNTDGVTGVFTKDILITNFITEELNDDLVITGTGFSLDQTTKLTLTDEIARDMDHGKVMAFKAEIDGEGNIISYTDLTSSIVLANPSIIASVNNAPITGGIYMATYQVTDNGKTVEAIIPIVVTGTHVVVDPTGTIVIAANGYVSSTPADYTDVSKAIVSSSAVALNLTTNVELANEAISLSDSSEITYLDSIDPKGSAANLDGGVGPLTFTATEGDMSASVTVEVVIPGNTVTPDQSGNTIYVLGKDVVLTNEEALAITTEELHGSDKINAISKVVETSEVLEVSISDSGDTIATINNAPVTGAIYSVVLTASYTDADGVVHVVNHTVSVIVEGTNIVIDPNVGALLANDFTIDNADAVGLTEAIALDSEHADAVAYLDGSETREGITVDKAELAVINAAPAEGGIYDLTVDSGMDSNGNSIINVIKVTVRGTNVVEENGLNMFAKGFVLPYSSEDPSVITAAMLTEAIALESGYSAAIAIHAIDGTVITNLSVDATHLMAINNAPAEGGLYPLTITATAENGETISRTVNVLVTNKIDVISLVANGFVLDNDEAIVLTEDVALNADHANAIAMVEATGTLVDDITVNPSQITLINNTTDLGGIYDLEVTATEGVNTVTTTVKVTVKGKNVAIENGISLYAESFTIENSEAVFLDDAAVIKNGNVVAVNTTTSNSIDDIVSNPEQLSVIHATSSRGGIYDLNIIATEGENSVNKDIKVTVKGYGVVVENNISLYAESFTIPNSAAAGFTADGVLINGNVEAIVTNTGEVITDITIDDAGLAAINAAPAQGGIYPVTVTATNGDDSASIVIYVTVEGTNVVTGDINIFANGYTLTHDEATVMSEEDAKALSEIIAIDTFSGQVIENITANPDHIEAINNAPTTGGLFELEFTAINEEGVEATITVYVTVQGTNVIVVDGIAIEAYGFTIEYAESVNLTVAQLLEYSNARAWYVIDGVEITNLDVVAEHLNTIHNGATTGGFYDATITATTALTRNADAKAVSITIPVIVLGEHVVSESKVIAIRGDDATIHMNDAKDLDEASVLELLNAEAIVVATGEVLTVTADQGQLAYIIARANAGDLGTYPITIYTMYTDSEGNTYLESLELTITITGDLTKTGLSAEMFLYSMMLTSLLGAVLIVLKRRKETV